MINRLELLGFKNLNELLEKENHSFAGIIEDGKAVFQQVGAADEAIMYEGEIDGTPFYLESKTYQYGNLASIRVNGIEYAVNRRGLNIVVYRNSTQEVIDTVAFDTNDRNYICYR